MPQREPYYPGDVFFGHVSPARYRASKEDRDLPLPGEPGYKPPIPVKDGDLDMSSKAAASLSPEDRVRVEEKRAELRAFLTADEHATHFPHR